MQKCHDFLVYLITVTDGLRATLQMLTLSTDRFQRIQKEAPPEYQSYLVQVTKYQAAQNCKVQLYQYPSLVLYTAQNVGNATYICQYPSPKFNLMITCMQVVMHTPSLYITTKY